MQLIGTISGEVSASSFSILLSNFKIGKGSYVKLNHEDYGWVLARVGDIKRSLNNAGEEVVLARAHTIGYKKDGVVRFPKTPFAPQERVYLADGDLILRVLGLNKSRMGSIYLGVMDSARIPVCLDLNKTIRKHVSVLAMTGAGKSYTVGVILEELLKNDIPIVVIDPHGEYSSLKYENDDYDGMLAYGIKPAAYDAKIKEYTTNPLVNADAEKLSLELSFTAEDLSKIIPVKLADKQKLMLYNALRTMEGQSYSLQDLIDTLMYEKGRDKWKVISVLESLQKTGIFEGTPLKEKDIVKPGKASIIDMKGSEPWIQQMVVAKIARDLFMQVKIKKIPPFFLLVEEAHNFCPERGFGESVSSELLRTIASEGRKFGLHLCVVSQRPAKVDKNVLSQCNTQIILKVTNPNDLRAIGQSIEGFTAGMENEIKQLSVGQAIVVGECVEQPVTLNIRTRETRHVGAAEVKGKKKEKGIEKIAPLFVKAEAKEEKPEEAGEGGETLPESRIQIKLPIQKEPVKTPRPQVKKEGEAKEKVSNGPGRAKKNKKGFRKRIIGIFLKDEEEL